MGESSKSVNVNVSDWPHADFRSRSNCEIARSKCAFLRRTCKKCIHGRSTSVLRDGVASRFGIDAFRVFLPCVLFVRAIKRNFGRKAKSRSQNKNMRKFHRLHIEYSVRLWTPLFAWYVICATIAQIMGTSILISNVYSTLTHLIYNLVKTDPCGTGHSALVSKYVRVIRRYTRSVLQ